MKFAIINDETSIFVIAASTLQEFEEFKGGYSADGTTGEITDILEMLSNPLLASFQVAPYTIEFDDPTTRHEVIATNDIQMVELRIAKREYHDMVERAALEARHTTPKDRRTLAEVCNLVDDDPWSKMTEEQREASKQQADSMQKVRDSGGLTGDSFGGSDSDKISVRGTTVTLDKDNNVIGVSVQAAKTMISEYELIVEGDFDLTDLFDQMRIPENRIEEQEAGRAVVRFHDFQIKTVQRILEGHGVTYSLNIILEETEKLFDDYTNGDTSQQIYYAVVTQNYDGIGEEEAKSVIATHKLDGKHWLVCLRKSEAEAIAAQVAGDVVATNKNGRAVLTADASAMATIIDTHEEVNDHLPRAWNDRAAEIDTMTDEEREENIKTIKANEFVFAAESHPKYRTLVHIVPEAHFRATGALWTGDLPIEHLLPKGFLTPLGDGMFSIHYDLDLAMTNLIKQGFAESILLHIYLNELRSEEIAESVR